MANSRTALPPWQHGLFVSGVSTASDVMGPAISLSITGSIGLIFLLRSFPLRSLMKNQDFKQGCDKTQTYFLAHVIVNSIICVLTFYDVIRVLHDPIANGYNGDYDLSPTIIQVGFHIAHMIVDYKTLSAELWAHHILSSVLLGGFDLYFRYGPLLNYCLFFATGLPGGLNYANQFFRKIGVIRKSESDLIYAKLDTWIRMPSLVMGMAFAHACWATGNLQAGTPAWVQVLQYIFTGGNSIYFGAQAIEINAAGAAKAGKPKSDEDKKKDASSSAPNQEEEARKQQQLAAADKPRKWAVQVSRLPLYAFLLCVCTMPYFTAYPRGSAGG